MWLISSQPVPSEQAAVFNLHLHLPSIQSWGHLGFGATGCHFVWSLEAGPCLMPRRYFSFPDHGETDTKYVIGGVSQLEIMNFYHQFFRLKATVLLYVIP